LLDLVEVSGSSDIIRDMCGEVRRHGGQPCYCRAEPSAGSSTTPTDSYPAAIALVAFIGNFNASHSALKLASRG
jgi:hypothetical protein